MVTGSNSGPGRRGLKNHAAGALDPAVAAYREAARISLRSARHLLRRGHACRIQGQLDQALTRRFCGKRAWRTSSARNTTSQKVKA